MRRALFAFAVVPFLLAPSALAGDAEIKAAQTVIDSQLKAFVANDGARAKDGVELRTSGRLVEPDVCI